MLIDWFTVIAQIVNFLVLVWLLKIFLYKPILKAISDRQKAIQAQLDDAQQKKLEAEAEREKYQKLNTELESLRVEKINKIQEEANVMHEQLLSQAQLDVENQKAKWYDSLKSEKEELLQSLSHRVQKEVFSIANKTIADLAQDHLEEHIIESFLKRLEKLPKQEKDLFIAALPSAGTLQIKTSAELSEAQREKIKIAVHNQFEKKVTAAFIVEPELISGIELLSDGHKMSWNIADYLSSLESQLDKVLQGESELKP